MVKRWRGEEILSNLGPCLPELCPSSMAMSSSLLSCGCHDPAAVTNFWYLAFLQCILMSL